MHSSTAILSEKYRISSELRSQATAGPVSTTVGDHVGIRGAVGSLFFRLFSFVVFLFRMVVAGSPSPPAFIFLLPAFSLTGACMQLARRLLYHVSHLMATTIVVGMG